MITSCHGWNMQKSWSWCLSVWGIWVRYESPWVQTLQCTASWLFIYNLTLGIAWREKGVCVEWDCLYSHNSIADVMGGDGQKFLNRRQGNSRPIFIFQLLKSTNCQFQMKPDSSPASRDQSQEWKGGQWSRRCFILFTLASVTFSFFF